MRKTRKHSANYIYLSAITMGVLFYYFAWPSLYLLYADRALIKKYPDVIISRDYGVLDEDDIGTVVIQQTPMPFGPHSITRYWQCFPHKMVDLKCHFTPGGGPLDDQDAYGETDIEVNTGKEIHHYFDRHVWNAKICQERLNEWKRLAQDEDIICLLGRASEPEPEVINGKQFIVRYWEWDRLKTKKGCSAFFGGDCKLETWIKEYGYQPKNVSL